MNDTFKINAYFDEKGETIEKIISYYLIIELNKKNQKIKSWIFEFAKKEIIIQ